MQYTCLEIQERVLETLQADTTLSAYVKKFDIGEENVSRKLFPYVTVKEVTADIEPLCIGAGAPNMNRYQIVIQAGTYHTLAAVARNGSESTGKKGILQLTDDIISAVFPNSFGKILSPTVHLRNVNIGEASSAGRSWKSTIVLTGFRKS